MRKGPESRIRRLAFYGSCQLPYDVIKAAFDGFANQLVLRFEMLVKATLSQSCCSHQFAETCFCDAVLAKFVGCRVYNSLAGRCCFFSWSPHCENPVVFQNSLNTFDCICNLNESRKMYSS